ncbi:hypothetical protein Rhe02_35580 [Rhizocola hellebori]|uniref:Bacterial transcriptional activator domain-containing protein n=1 Tax=Rhizocola hellebori TaxID=1392758 RepID=A0A8J3Q7W3_9ACTN|nr:tetratricopeptide repeat protein [Rhizocola hellebori]GIH05491.1 hypothetical protein Rhe02_35580 [Rhizocola hellebori]
MVLPVIELVVAAAGYGKTSLLRQRYPAATWHSGVAGLTGGDTVIDDLPMLTPDAAQALFASVDALPSGARVAIASRFPLPVLPARLRGLAQVRPAELALSAEAATELLENEYGLRDLDLSDQVHTMTGGWPALVRLAGEAVAAGEPVLPEPGSALWSFVSEEVLAPLPQEVRALLVDLADLTPVSAGLGEALGHAEAASWLRMLTAMGLLCDDRVIPIVAHVAREDAPGNGLAMLAARWYEEAGHPCAALKAFARAGDLVQCGRLLDRHGQEILAEGHGSLIIDILTKNTNRSRQQQLLLGDAVRTSGSSLAAAQIYGIVAEAEPVWDAAIAWRMGMLHYHRGDSRAALETFERARDDAEPSTDQAMLSAWRASARLQLGEIDTAVALANLACQQASAVNDDLALATAHVTLALCDSVSGRDADSEEHNLRALELAEKVGSALLRARILASQTFRHLCEAKYVAALATAQQNAHFAALAGHSNLRAVAYCNSGDALMMLGKYDQAIRQFQRAEAIFRRVGPRRAAPAQLGLGEVYRRRGWAEQARAAFESALELAQEAGTHHVQVSALCGLARLFAPEDPQHAATFAQRATELASDRVVVAALLASGWVAHHAGDRATATKLATEAAERASAERDPAGLADSLELRAIAEPDPARARNALREAFAVWTQAQADVEAARVGHRLGHLVGAGVGDRLGALEAAETLARAGVAPETADTAAVTVRAFGRFEVWLDGQPVPAARWQSRRARDLLRILVARRGRPVPRDELREMLWRGEDSSGHRLSVLLSIIRRVLDPERVLASDHYIVADQASVGLDIGRLRVDVEDFLADLVHARRLRERGALDEAERLLSACLDRYRADVFEDEPYAEWAVALREEARGGYLSVLRMLAQISRKRGRPGVAVGHLLRLLSADPYDEAGHRALIEALVAGGQHGEAKRARDRYLNAMRAIGVKPA